MRMKSLILIFIALGCGLVASIGISQVMNSSGSGSANLEVEQILVALADIDIGAKLSAQNVKLEDWPKAKVPEGAIRRLDDIKDKYASSRFFRGEPLHINKVTDQLGTSVKVPPGYRAMPVKVEEDTVMKAIAPGDRVDVMVFLRRGNEIPETGAFTILKNVRVFAVNTDTERGSDGKSESANFRTVSLLVKPDHARELAVAAQMGKILLTLRRPDETDEDQGEEATPIEEILRGRSKLASEPTPEPAPQPTEQVVPSLPEGAAPEWVMTVMGPRGAQQFNWINKKELPIEATKKGGGALSAEPGGSASHGNTQETSRPSQGNSTAQPNDLGPAEKT